ncbi:Transposase zinc-ribbon domain-containing protein [Alkalimonas amylolytica]|uniref:Transposase zinc-ribbon domain-containing protein n=2 Tax=Alkalimonas amylolytica TaxID=152573 RepID=A0A1H4G1H5_ALKAM|nr:Transposase zinc-ribbon domain-containing protein [Alkalimonas amylolytica]SEA97881.1 Transposase zinc-ribbon domain-containing protein [Alkalimonas amylolytica]SEB02778.1 Transposase zinc-ribbon domain-containing protein [Alkalimonas amylolytica]
MSQHWLLSSAVRDLSIMDIADMSEEDAFKFFCEVRWGNQTTQSCLSCGAIDQHFFRASRRQWRCKHCDAYFSVTTKTVWADRKLSFKKLLLMLFVFTSSPNGISASSLSRKLGVAYKTAWIFCHKLREALMRTEDKALMSGEVHVDGGHFGGKPRSGQFRNKAKPEAIAEKIKLGKSQGAKRSKISRANFERKKRNRRIVMVVRQVTPGLGGVRTRCFLAKAEDDSAARFIAQNYIEKGALVRTDECPAYSMFSSRFIHETVEHSKEYSTIDGVNNNQAESFFSRLRRSEYGTFHRMMARYMLDYCNEMTWREDHRRTTEGFRFTDALRRSLIVGYSRWWRCYGEGVRRGSELLFNENK